MAVSDLRGGAVRVDYLDFGRGLSLSRRSVGGEQVLSIQGGGIDLSGGIVGINGAPVSGVPLTVVDTDGTSSEETLRHRATQTTPADDDIIYQSWFFDDSAGSSVEVARLYGIARDVTAGTIDGGVRFEIMQAGTLRDIFHLQFNTSGQGEAIINSDGVDVNTVIEGLNNTLLFNLDAGLDNIGFGAGPVTGAFFSITAGAQSRAYATGVGVGIEIPLDTYTDTDTASGTNAIQALVSLGTPTFGATSGTSVITRGATLYIEGAPAQGSNMTLSAAHALWIDAGSSRFEGAVDIIGNLTADGSHAFEDDTAATTAPLVLTNDTGTQTSFHALQLVGADSALGADNDEVYMTFHMRDEESGPTAAEEQGRITLILQNAEGGAMDSQFVFNTMIADTLTAGLTFGSAGAAAAFSFGFGTSNFVRVAFTLSEATSDFELDDSETTLNNQQVLRALISTLQSHGILV